MSDETAVNIRKFPVDLHRRLKARAVMRGMDLRDLVIEYCEKGLEQDDVSEPGIGAPGPAQGPQGEPQHECAEDSSILA